MKPYPRRAIKGKPTSAPPVQPSLFDQTTPAAAVPAEPTPTAARSAQLTEGAWRLLGFYVTEARLQAGERGFLTDQTLSISAARVATATGLPEQRIASLRRELLVQGFIIVGRPRGLTPEVRVCYWRCSENEPLPVETRIDAACARLEEVLWDLGMAVRVLVEMDRMDDAGEVGEQLSRVRRALATHDIAESETAHGK